MSKIRTPAMEKLDKKVKKNAKVTSNTPGREAIKRLRKNKTAMAGMIIILIMFIVAILARSLHRIAIRNRIIQQSGREHL